jgi:hypothetical protein
MALPVLEELKQELARVCVAGSGLAKGDPRLLKYLPTLSAMGKKAPVFNSMAAKLKSLCEDDNSPENLMDLSVMLFSVLYTQSASPDTTGWPELEYAEESLPPTVLPCSALSGALYDIDKKSAYAPDRLEPMIEKGLINDPRLYRALCRSISGGDSSFEDFLEEKVFPVLDKAAEPFLKAELAISTGKRAHKIRWLIEKMR